MRKTIYGGVGSPPKKQQKKAAKPSDKTPIKQEVKKPEVVAEEKTQDKTAEV